MPDFERIFDKARVDLASTEEDRQYEIGFTAGKTRARKEVLVVFVICLVALFMVQMVLF
jgi:Flp pilus assembly protein TadB